MINIVKINSILFSLCSNENSIIYFLIVIFCTGSYMQQIYLGQWSHLSHVCLKVRTIIILKIWLKQAMILNYPNYIHLLLFLLSIYHVSEIKGTPLFAVHAVRPKQRLYKTKSSFLNPIWTSASRKSCLVLVHKRDLFTVHSFSVVFVFVMTLQMYPSDFSLIRVKLK